MLKYEEEYEEVFLSKDAESEYHVRVIKKHPNEEKYLSETHPWLLILDIAFILGYIVALFIGVFCNQNFCIIFGSLFPCVYSLFTVKFFQRFLERPVHRIFGIHIKDRQADCITSFSIAILLTALVFAMYKIQFISLNWVDFISKMTLCISLIIIIIDSCFK